MRVEMSYGRGTLPVDLDDDWKVTVIEKPDMPVLGDPDAAVEAAVGAPLGCPPLSELAQSAKTACILICDITRPVPNGTVLPVLIRTLLEAGMQADNIQVLVATGLHRPNEGAELAELVGDPWVLETVKIDNHFARNDADHVSLGKTKRGTVVRLDKRFVHADLRIATGLVEPHFMAGFSGGRKVVTPGVAHAETITTLHTAPFMEHENAANLVLDGNPLHEEQLEVIGLLGSVYAVNTVIDDTRRLSFVNFGEIGKSHLQAVDFIMKYAVVSIPERFSTVLSSSAGYPLDKTYYQTVKGMVSPIDILKPGGDIIIVSEISEGFGSPEYLDAQKRLIEKGTDGFIESILHKSHAAIDEWQTEYQIKAMRVGSIQLYTEALSQEERALTGVELIGSVEDALRRSVARHGNSEIAVIPEGPYVVPLYSED
ncbi:MAG: nickel-dependent lactate racemase [Rhodospirillales bacterium]|nr:nickel-dependent lactate racemase [Rhodospirillales bacterium]